MHMYLEYNEEGTSSFGELYWRMFMYIVKGSSGIKMIFAVIFSFILTLAMMPMLPLGGDAVYATTPTTHEFNITNGSVTISDGTDANTVKVSQTGQTDQNNIPAADTITLTGTTTANMVSVTTTHNITIVLKNLSIDVSGNDNNSTFSIAGSDAMTNRTVTVKLAGTNELNCGENHAGLEKNGDKTTSGSLIINDDEATDGIGSLTANGGRGAGIGGRGNSSGENITISGGKITAESVLGAGIGGGYSGIGNNISISGGTVAAQSCAGAGIGGGDHRSGNHITISGGDILASTVPGSRIKDPGNAAAGVSNTGAAIGGGREGTADNIIISGGTVIAKTISSVIIDGCTFADEKNGAAIGGGAKEDNGSYTLADGGSLSSGTNGHAWIIADSSNSKNINSVLDTVGSEFSSGVIFTGTTGKVHGTPTIQTDAEVPSGSTLTIDSSNGITIGNGLKLTNKGTIINNGMITNKGTFKDSVLMQGTGTYTGKFTLLFGNGGNEEMTIDTNGGNLNLASMALGNNNTELTITGPTRSSYRFSGWSDGTITYGSTDAVTLTDGKTLTAQWIYIPPTYSVTLNGNDGAGTALTTYTYGTGATLPTDWTKDGYTFVGWYDNAEFTGDAVTTISTTESGARTYYAKWTKNAPELTAPAAPTNVKAKATGKHSVKVTWTKSKTATSYKVYKAASKNGKYYFVGSAKDGDLTAKNLKANKTYYFKVKAINSSGSSEFSKVASAKIKVKKNSVKFALKNIKGNNIKVSWKGVKDAKGYQVANNATINGKLKVQWTVGSNARTYFSMHKTKGKTYKFKMRYFKMKDGKKVYSSWTSVKTIKVD